MVERVMVLWLAVALCSGCECGPKQSAQDGGLPEGFEAVMQEHAGLSVAARDALIRGDLPVAQQAMRKLAFFMEHVPPPERGEAYARITRELVEQVREASDLEEACMCFARLSYACGQCHHALDRGPPIKLEPAPGGEDFKMHMRRHYWAIERMWEALLADSTAEFQSAAEVLAEAPLHGQRDPDEESHPGVTRLAYEVHDLAFAAAVEGKVREDEYVPQPGEPLEDDPTTWGQAEVFGRLLGACYQCHDMLEVRAPLTPGERQKADQ
ncbi:MAG: hypothetical protein JRE81_06130 [Deltaproteobacteria bacterium]|jgi:hypothetical protein|nr:hypothetical protein [Deltaproteobacteria bacterium]